MTNLPEDARHIAFYLPSLRGGGAERVMVTVANGVAARGHRVDLVLAKAEGPYLAEVSANVRVIDLKSHRVLASLPRLIAYLRRERPQSMLSALSHANIVAIVARVLSNVKCRLVVSEHSAPSRALVGPGMPSVMAGLIRATYPRADTVVCVSEGMKQEMRNLLPGPEHNLVAIYNPLDLDRIRRMAQQPVTHDWPTGINGPIIVAAGRLTKAKDYPNLLRAFALLSATHPARLMILGQGELHQPLKALAQDLGIANRVAFMGFQENPFAWMRAADLYVMSSQWEGLPGTLMEAMACGARIVSTDCRTGPDEILEAGKWGRLVPVNDPEALAGAMIMALDDPNAPDVSARAEAFRADRIITRYEAQLI
jgi:glycosyltransferase involved in cell wall biosynthesis